MSAPCLVSVVIPCFNAAEVIPRAVRSVVAQETADTEIIVVDDASTDETVAVAQRLQREFEAIRLVCQPANAGPASARNAGLGVAMGRYVCFLDADDEYARGFFATALPRLEQDPSLAWIATGVELVNCHRPVHPVQLEAMANSLPSNLIMRTSAVKFMDGFPDDPVFRAETAGEDVVFRATLKRLFLGARRPERFLRYWVSRGSHFDRFLDRTKVVNGELIFGTMTPDESSGAVLSVRNRYQAQACERLSVFAALANPEETCPRLMDRRLGSVVVYDELRARFDGIQGFLDPQEGFALYQFARDGPGTGAIVEIGSLLGRSTCWLAAGTSEIQREKVVAVDHFRGSPEHQKEGAHCVAAVAETGTTFPAFITNLQRSGLRSWVDVRVGASAKIGADWQGPIRLLFIDGDHSYEATRADVEIWSKHVAPGGLMALHDVDVWPGVTQAYGELLAAKLAWKQVAKVRSLRVLQRGVQVP